MSLNIKSMLLGTLLMMSSSWASAVILETTPSTPNVNPGETFDLSIDISDIAAAGIATIHADLYYDTSVLTLTDASSGDFFTNNPLSLWADADTFGLTEGDPVNTLIIDPTTSPDVLGFDFAEFNFSPSLNDGTLVNLSFQADRAGRASFALNDVLILDGAGGLADTAIIVNDVTVIGEVPLPPTLALLGLGMMLMTYSKRRATALS